MDNKRNLEKEKTIKKKKTTQKKENINKAKPKNITKKVKSKKEQTLITKKEKLQENKSIKNNKKAKKTIYFGFYNRLLISLIILLALVLCIGMCLKNLIKYNKAEEINYSENGKINYYVTIKNNDFYEGSKLNKNMLYIASLIDEINVAFNYNLNLEDNLNLDLNYDIVGKLVIKNATGDKVYFEKEYKLDSSSAIVENKKKYNYFKKVNIDYNYYNQLVSSFKTKYGVDSTSYLRVIFNIKKKSENLSLENRDMYIDIPLSQRDVNITLSPMELKNSSKVVKERSVEFKNVPLNTVCILILLMFTIYDGIIILKLINSLMVKKSKYTKTLKKILREYDRLIIETRVAPDLEEKNVIKLYEFKELLDVRDNLKLPVMFCEVVKEQKACFYISHEKNVFIYILKSVDLEKK